MNTSDMKTVNGHCKPTLAARAQHTEDITMDANPILLSAPTAKCKSAAEMVHESENDLLPQAKVEKGIKQKLCLPFEPNKAFVLHETKTEDISIKEITEYCSDEVLNEAGAGFAEKPLLGVQSLGSINDSPIKEHSGATEWKPSDSDANADADLTNVNFNDAKLIASEQLECTQILPLKVVSVVQKNSLSETSASPQSFENHSEVSDKHDEMCGRKVITRNDITLSLSEQNTQACVLPISSCQIVEDSVCKNIFPNSLKANDECNTVPIRKASGKGTNNLMESSVDLVTSLPISSMQVEESKDKPVNFNPLVTDRNGSAAVLCSESNLAYSENQAESIDLVENETAGCCKDNRIRMSAQFQQKLKPEPELKLASDASFKAANDRPERFHKRGASLPDSAKILSYACETNDTGNENVSRQHVRFEAARKQWLMLEMANKSQKPCPRVSLNVLQNNELSLPVYKKCTGRDYQSSVKGMKSTESFHISSQLLDADSKENQRQVKKVNIEQIHLANSAQSIILKEGLKKQESYGFKKNAQVQDFTLKPHAPSCDDSGVIDSSSSLHDDGSAGSRPKDPSVHSPDDTGLSSVPSDCLSDEFTITSLPTSSTPSPKSETPIEKEIRLSLEREESLRLSRGMYKAFSPDDCVNITSCPSQVCSSGSSSGKPKQLAEMQMQREILIAQQREADLVQQRRSTCVSDKDTNVETEVSLTLDTLKQTCSTPNSDKQLSPWVENSSAVASFPVNVSSSSLQGSSYCEMVADHVIILDSDVLMSSQPGVAPVDSSSEWVTETANLVILETPNILVHSAVDNAYFPLSKMEPKYSIQNNPFFKLRSSGSPILDQEIRKAHEREDELRRQRDSVYGQVLPKTTASIMGIPGRNKPFASEM